MNFDTKLYNGEFGKHELKASLLMILLEAITSSILAFFDRRLFIGQLQLTYSILQLFYSRRAIVDRHPVDSGNGGLDLTTVLALLAEIVLETLILNAALLTGRGGDGGGADGDDGEELHLDVVA